MNTSSSPIKNNPPTRSCPLCGTSYTQLEAFVCEYCGEELLPGVIGPDGVLPIFLQNLSTSLLNQLGLHSVAHKTIPGSASLLPEATAFEPPVPLESSRPTVSPPVEPSWPAPIATTVRPFSAFKFEKDILKDKEEDEVPSEVPPAYSSHPFGAVFNPKPLPPPSVPPAFFHVRLSDGGVREFVLEKAETSVGRGTADFDLSELEQNEPKLSRKHAIFSYKNNSWYITDLNSTNKTIVGDQEIAANTPILLHDNTEIILGKSLMITFFISK